MWQGYSFSSIGSASNFVSVRFKCSLLLDLFCVYSEPIHKQFHHRIFALKFFVQMSDIVEIILIE